MALVSATSAEQTLQHRLRHSREFLVDCLVLQIHRTHHIHALELLWVRPAEMVDPLRDVSSSRRKREVRWSKDSAVPWRRQTWTSRGKATTTVNGPSNHHKPREAATTCCDLHAQLHTQAFCFFTFDSDCAGDLDSGRDASSEH